MKDKELLARLDALDKEIAGSDQSAAMASFMAKARLLKDHPHLRGKRVKARKVALSKVEGERVEERRRQYQEYINSDAWRSRREVAIRKAGGRCATCYGTNRIEVHHRTYIRFGAEMEDDLTVLCHACHDLFSKHGRLTRAA